MAQLKERLAAAEENARQRKERHQEQKTVLQDALNAEQARHKTRGKTCRNNWSKFLPKRMRAQKN